MALARNVKEKQKVTEIVSIMLESSFYLDMKLAERLKLVKMIVESHYSDSSEGEKITEESQKSNKST